MDLRPNDHATLLLTAHLPNDGPLQPLAPGEWSRFSAWLKGQGIAPSDLFVGDPRHTLAAFQDKSVTLERLLPLLDRGAQIGFLLDKWQRAGLWVITRSSPDYPMLLQERLGDGSPPLFYGAGDRKKLDTKALAVVGSRNAGEEDLHFARQLGHSAAQQGWSIVSGGARGVDEASMRGAIEAQGTVIGVVADSLLKTANSFKYRDAIQRSDIVLLCPYHPESGFSGPNAMSRNKHVYCLSRAAVVVCSDAGKGGTWAGANEDLKKKWVPLWVKHQADLRSGNRALVERGALVLPDVNPHVLRMEELEHGSLSNNELFAGQPAEANEPVATYEKPKQAPPLKSNGMARPSDADDMEAVLKALTTPMTDKALAKHLDMTLERINKLLEHLIHLHKVEPPVGRKKSYKLAAPDLFSTG
ncbi:MAG TPA: DNA-processing protein DprA [Flavobacteriales bacterium]|nr:DNA-processing protein DprA [Flavobacteriales bacterium]